MAHKTSDDGKRSRDARVVRTREALRAALLSLLREHDLAAVTAQAIVAEAGVGYATFFRHFPSVEALLIDVADALIGEFIAATMPAIVAGDRAAILAALTGYVAAQRSAVGALLVGGGETVRREIVARAIAQTQGLPLSFDPAVPRDLAVTHAVVAAIAVLTWWVSAAEPVAADAAAALIDRLALAPLS